MKKLLITLMLISPFSFADWGDVYYCQMTSYSETSLEGKRTDYNLKKFQFKLDQTKNAMVFGKGGYFSGSVLGLWFAESVSYAESWYAGDNLARAYFDKGKFLYSLTGTTGIVSISANCDKF